MKHHRTNLACDRLQAYSFERHDNADRCASNKRERVLNRHSHAKFGKRWDMAHYRHLVCQAKTIRDSAISQRRGCNTSQADSSPPSIPSCRKTPAWPKLEVGLIHKELEKTSLLETPASH